MRKETKAFIILAFILLSDFLIFLISWNFNSSTLPNNKKSTEEGFNEIDLNVNQDLLTNFSDIPRKRVFFDMTHEQMFNIWDTGFFGYSEFNILFQNYYIEPSVITRSLTSYIMNMTSEDILVLGVAKYANYSNYEINNITGFVDRGGKLIILTDHNIFDIDEFQNPVLEYFNISMTSKDLLDPINNIEDPNGLSRDEWIIFNSSFFSLSNLSIEYGSVLNVTGNAFAIANSSHTANYPNEVIMAGYENVQGGKVFAASDPEWLCNFEDPYGGINYGNNSLLILKVLDWFYNSNLSLGLEDNLSVSLEYNLFSSPMYSNFTLNITLTKNMNITTEIRGGELFPQISFNAIGKTNWEVNVSDDGYIKFTFTNSSQNINFSKNVYFFEQNSSNEILFLQNNYSRAIDPSRDGLLNLAYYLKEANFSVFASEMSLNYSRFKCLFIVNPLEKFHSSINTAINQSSIDGTRVIFLNYPYSSLNCPDLWFSITKSINFTTKEVPINNISTHFGVNFTYHILADSELNSNNKLYFPEIIGTNQIFYNISIYMASIINTSDDFVKEVEGFPSSWGDPRSIFASYGNIGDHDKDINNTIIMAHNNKTLASGMLNYFSNEYFNPSNYFNDFFHNWIEEGYLNKKYQLNTNQTNFYYNNTNINIFSSEKIRNHDGFVVENGTLFNVVLNKGEILDKDEAPGISGFQTIANNGSISVKISSKEDRGLFMISIYNSTKYNIILSVIINLSVSAPILQEPLIYSNGTISLQWNVDNSSTRYYIFREFNNIDNNSNLIPIAIVYSPNNSFIENLTNFGIYYYVIIASNTTENSSISNCVKVDLKPLLMEILPNPNNNGEVVLNWISLVGASRYYVLKSDIVITEDNYYTSSVILIANTTNLYHIDDSNLNQETTYYYVVIGSNISANSTISDYESILIHFIPQSPYFSKLYLLSYWEDVIIEWSSVLYAFNYCIYISSQQGFIPSEANIFIITGVNSSILTNLNHGTYYIKVKSIGQYGNSSFSDELTLKVILFIPIESDNPWPLLILIISLFSISTVFIFSYFWFYLKKQKKHIIREYSEKT